jgi:hypothetical protein
MQGYRYEQQKRFENAVIDKIEMLRIQRHTPMMIFPPFLTPSEASGGDKKGKAPPCG